MMYARWLNVTSVMSGMNIAYEEYEGQPLRVQQSGKWECRFCGGVNDDDENDCPRCYGPRKLNLNGTE
jgi:rubrerythrin